MTAATTTLTLTAGQMCYLWAVSVASIFPPQSREFARVVRPARQRRSRGHEGITHPDESVHPQHHEAKVTLDHHSTFYWVTAYPK
jgi:hypothetical protein